MATVRASVVLALLCAVAHGEVVARPNLTEWEDDQAAKAANASATAAREAKMAALNKVSSMLEGLKAQVLDEGEKEAATYNKFACFCKDTTADKVAAISAGKDQKASLEAEIVELSTKRDELDDLIAQTVADIKAAEKEMKTAEFFRAKEADVYAGNDKDLQGAIYALENAIETLKASKAPSMAQLQAVGKTVREAALLADTLSIGGAATHRAAAAFLQQNPDVPMEDYKFHSDDIIATLEKLLDDFRAEKVEIDKEEVSAIAAHESFMQEKTDYVKQKNIELEQAKADKAATAAKIAEKSEELSTVSATLLDDQQYLDELSKMCSDKAKTWDQRSRIRQDELSMLTTVIGIISGEVTEKTSAATLRFAQESVGVTFAVSVARDSDAMSSIEAAAEAADDASPPVFMQLRGVQRHVAAAAPESDGRQAVAELLRTSGDKLKSTLLTALASKISGSADPFVKIKKLIQELIERLLTEAANESNQKGWCDKATADAVQKRTYAAEAVAKLNGEMAELEALRDKLLEEIGILKEEIAKLIADRDTAEKERAAEKAENKATVLEAEEGLKAIAEAIDIMKKFYLTTAKETVDLSFVQGPAEDAPETFAIGDAYKGAQSTKTGILGMMEVMQSDFERTISETEYAEAQAEQAHLEFMTETGKSLVAKQTAEAEKTSYKDNAVEKLEAAEADLNSQTEVLQTAISELLDLKPVCVDTGMSYEERVSRRDDEIASLNKALCILTAYAKYGAGGAGSEAC
jgi:hypothetical protein